MSTVLAFKNSKRSSPRIVNGGVAPPRRVANLARRSREHLTAAEVERLIVAAVKVGRHGVRDGALILLAYRHGLRVGELVELRWEQVDFQCGTLHVNRKKSGDAATHPTSLSGTSAVESARFSLTMVADADRVVRLSLTELVAESKVLKCPWI